MKYQFILHGFLTIMVSNIGGIVYSKAIRKLVANEAGWRLLHSAGMMGGIMLLAFASFFDDITAGFPLLAKGLFGVILGSNYFFLAGMLIAAYTAARGVDKEEKGRGNKVVYTCYYIAALLGFVYTGVFIWLGMRRVM
ncbi:hypothetical protein HHL17_03020 [Chitinophaga sp. G-6-1-13]|uniref:Uncharacterized protein n=1 Tax=Chitinophaga fulva TaxID=2728842 RepID=A0A848GHF5_9BACT|nr:hypothetical protein [Chitinophaga fulva]NML36160.1 hypothetical protein [Chitinophaga fulva]